MSTKSEILFLLLPKVISKEERGLITLPKGSRAIVVRVTPEHSATLLSCGIYPGVEIQLLQKFPTHVIRYEETELALDSSVSRAIWTNATANLTPGTGTEFA